MSTENITRGYVVRYSVPFHLQYLFKLHIRHIGAASNADHTLAGAYFTVSGSRDEHQLLKDFLNDCRNEMRTLYIANRSVDRVLEEAAMWGLNVYPGKRGLLLTRASVTGETQILDRFEKFLSSYSIG